jgi:hypothetical protein
MVKHEVRPIRERQNYPHTSGVMRIPLDRVGGLKSGCGRLIAVLEIVLCHFESN